MRVTGTRLVLGVVVGVVMGAALAVVGPAGATAAVDDEDRPPLRPEWGWVDAKSGALKAGCRNYRYRYEVTAPEESVWDLNVRVVDPRGRTVWFGYLKKGADPAAGTATYRLCRSQSVPGRYKLKAVVSTVDFADEEVHGRLETAKFRLRARR